ncbi:MAG TPA: DNA repair protein RecO [Anaerolineae bacterium]|nr:DNA repair protein RecO [Anaerolineae bacterium]
MSSRERVYRTEAIVLRRTDFGEADRLLTTFTPERGKIRLVAKGARKPSSRKSGHVELFSYDLFVVATGHSLDIITQAETLEPYRPLREDLLRTTYAYYVAELADGFAAERDENRPVFDLLKDTFGWLCTAQDLQLVARYFEVRFLGLVGYQPQLFVCSGCQKDLEPEVSYLSVGDGSALCRKCGQDRPGTMALSVNALKVLRFLQTREWETCRTLRLAGATHAEVEQAMSRYITYHLERKLKSVEFLQHLRRQMAAGEREEP